MVKRTHAMGRRILDGRSLSAHEATDRRDQSPSHSRSLSVVVSPTGIASTSLGGRKSASATKFEVKKEVECLLKNS